MKEQILSRSRIEPIIRQFNLFSKGNPSMDDRVEMMQKAIGVKPIPASQSSHGMPGFYITFKRRTRRRRSRFAARSSRCSSARI